MMTTSRRQRRFQRTARFDLERLDDRIVPSAIGARVLVAPPVLAVHIRHEPEATLGHAPAGAKLAASNPAVDVSLHAASAARAQRAHAPHHRTHLPAKVSARLRRVYAQYQAFLEAGAQGSFTTVVNGAIVNGSQVGIKVQTTNPRMLQKTLTRLQNSGFQVTQVSGSNGTITGVLPIGQLPAVAQIPSAVTVTLPSNYSAQLQSLFLQYESYVNAGGKGTFTPTGVSMLQLNGTNVGISVHTTDTAHFQTYVTKLQSAGLQVLDQSESYGIIDGMLPIGQLPAVAVISPSFSVTPLLKPVLQ